jgi:hypothetical protein
MRNCYIKCTFELRILLSRWRGNIGVKGESFEQNKNTPAGVYPPPPKVKGDVKEKEIERAKINGKLKL